MLDQFFTSHIEGNFEEDPYKKIIIEIAKSKKFPLDLVMKAFELRSSLIKMGVLLNFGCKIKEELLIKNYNDERLLRCLAYHIFIGSTPDPSQIEFFDFEGEDSILKKAEGFI